MFNEGIYPTHEANFLVIVAKNRFKLSEIGMMALIFPSFLIVSHSFYLFLYRLSGLIRQYINHRLFRPIK